jgi:hypothetical protein
VQEVKNYTLRAQDHAALTIDLCGRDIILIDVTILSGLLILLTISSFSPAEFPNRSIFISITVPIVAVFAFSAIEVLENRTDRARKLSKGGFAMIIGFMVFLAVVNIINVIAPDFRRKTPVVRKIVSNRNNNQA